MTLTERCVQLLRESRVAMTTAEVANALSVESNDCSRALGNLKSRGQVRVSLQGTRIAYSLDPAYVPPPRGGAAHRTRWQPQGKPRPAKREQASQPAQVALARAPKPAPVPAPPPSIDSRTALAGALAKWLVASLPDQLVAELSAALKKAA